jgi:dTDP-4-amino-4,6-dideoxygalactose transaminase
MTKKIPFNKPYLTGDEFNNLKNLSKDLHLSGDGNYTNFCNKWLEEELLTSKALITHSCTAALEMSAILLNIEIGDEVIMPSYTFVSTANAFVLRGAIPVFVDINKNTCNIDITKIESAITEKTKAIVVVHYAGISVDMDKVAEIANDNNLFLIEDAAQALMSEYKGNKLGTIGDIGTLSFHETKNIISGEGGAILIKKDNLIKRAEIIREKGTNRSEFYRGAIDKYTWVDLGSSFLPSEIIAAFLKPQLQNANQITNSRLDIWNKYHTSLEDYEKKGILKRPFVPEYCKHNAHMYYVVLQSLTIRQQLIEKLNNRGVSSVFHYIPLHSSPYGKKISRVSGEMKNTDNISDTLLRLPLWTGLDVEKVINILTETLDELNR